MLLIFYPWLLWPNFNISESVFLTTAINIGSPPRLSVNASIKYCLIFIWSFTLPCPSGFRGLLATWEIWIHLVPCKVCFREKVVCLKSWWKTYLLINTNLSIQWSDRITVSTDIWNMSLIFLRKSKSLNCVIILVWSTIIWSSGLGVVASRLSFSVHTRLQC